MNVVLLAEPNLAGFLSKCPSGKTALRSYLLTDQSSKKLYLSFTVLVKPYWSALAKEQLNHLIHRMHTKESKETGLHITVIYFQLC